MFTDRDNSTDSGSRRGREHKEDRYIVLRNILNVIFMLGALAGVVVYINWNRDAGTIVILVSMVFKIVECVFRFMK